MDEELQLLAAYGHWRTDVEMSEADRHELFFSILTALVQRAGCEVEVDSAGTMSFEYEGHDYAVSSARDQGPHEGVGRWVAEGRRWVLLVVLDDVALDESSAALIRQHGIVLDRTHVEAAVAGVRSLPELAASVARFKRRMPVQQAYVSLTELLKGDAEADEPARLFPLTRWARPVEVGVESAAGVSADVVLAGEAQSGRPLGMACRGGELLITNERGIAAVELGTGSAHWELVLPDCYGAPLVKEDGSVLVLCGSALVKWHEGRLTAVAGGFEAGSSLVAGPGGDSWVLSGSGVTFGAGTSTLALTRVGETVGDQLRYPVAFESAVRSAGWLGRRRFFLAGSGSSAVVDLAVTTGAGSREDWVRTAGHYPAHLLVAGGTVITASGDGSGNRVALHRTRVTTHESECLAEVRVGEVFGLAQSPDGPAYLLGSVPSNDPHLVQPVLVRVTGHRPASEAPIESPPADQQPEYEQVADAARGRREDYALDRLKLDDGGQGEVFRARHKPTGVMVAFKRRSGALMQRHWRMHREIAAAQALAGNLHVMRVLDFSPAHDWIVMPLAEATAEQRHSELQDPSAMRALIDAVASALAHAHGEGDGWLHRDIKPSNILFLDGRWVLADWGIVRRPRGQTTARRTGMELGTPGFAAPEMLIDPHHAGFSSDIYSLGQVIGWILTGRGPEPNRPLLPPPGPWFGVVRKTTQLDPRGRPQNIQEFLALVERETGSQTQLPAARAQTLLTAANNGDQPSAASLIELAADLPDDYALYLDDLTRLEPDMSGAALTARPQQAVDVIRAMTGHVHGDKDGKGPHYNEAKGAIGWLLNAAAHAAREQEWELLAEAADGLCTWDSYSSEWDQQDAIRNWLGRLTGGAAHILGYALREHPGSAAHFTELLGRRSTDPAILAAIHTATADRR